MFQYHQFQNRAGHTMTVALAEQRGDRCFQGKRGYYYYAYTPDWAIDESTVTGPFETAALAHGAAIEWEPLPEGASEELDLDAMLRFARIRIEEAELGLGYMLTSGMRRDLLKDNTDWDSDTVEMVVRHIDEEDAERYRAIKKVESFTITDTTADWHRKVAYRY
jgi:hypothetical protein